MNKTVLMCQPLYFSIEYEINPWMNSANPIDYSQALSQWDKLVDTYTQNGIKVEKLAPDSDCPDLVFTANAGLIYKNIFYPSNFRYPERQIEADHFIKWFTDHDYQIANIPKEIIFEGAGDALFCGDKLYVGFGFRSMKETGNFLQSQIRDFEVISLGLSNPYFYHLDTCFSPLPSGKYIFYPDAFDDETRMLLENGGGYEVSEEFCVNYGCNLVVANDTIFSPRQNNTLSDIARLENLKVTNLNMSEFIKSGGSIRCTTIFI